jgi:hypothetical protein
MFYTRYTGARANDVTAGASGAGVLHHLERPEPFPAHGPHLSRISTRDLPIARRLCVWDVME